MVETSGLADSWPDGGPPKLWSRELGDGYATIVADGDRLYTMYRRDDKEIVVALDARSGGTVWEFSYDSPHTELMDQFGPGPHSTPLVVGDRLYTVGINVVLHCLDKRSGEVHWKRDLVADFKAPIPERGYASSPIAYRGTIVIPVGGEKGQGLMAFRQSDGELVWKSLDAEVAYSSPILVDVDGRQQLVVVASTQLAGLDPASGELLWSQDFGGEANNLASPLWTGDDLLFVSAAYESGSRTIKLNRENGQVVPQELFYSRKLRIHHGNAIRVGDYVYGSSGDFGPAFLVCMNVRTGEVMWRERGFAKATFVYGDGKIILLDENGQLALATVTPQGVTIHSKCEVTEPHSWAAPTLAGTKLYVRDRKHIMAFDLS